MLRYLIMMVLCLALAGPGVAGEAGCALDQEPLRVVAVADAEQLQRAVADARPGDRIELADGDYDLEQALVVSVKATAEAPLVIAASNRLGARLTGAAGIMLSNCEYVGVEGLAFLHKANGPAFSMNGSRHCRLSQSHIRLREPVVTNPLEHRVTWISLSGENSGWNRIDHNLIEEKRNASVMLGTGGSGVETGNMSTRHDRIDNNHFRNFYKGTGNGFETIRLGSSTYSHSSGFITVEDNLFENCDGESEIISVKCNDNILRRNTFLNCYGALTLRNCHRCTVEGNIFISQGKRGSTGIRLFGQDHRILNNHMQGLDGAGIIIRTGDIEARTRARWEYEADSPDGVLDPVAWGGYQRPERTLVAHNTIVDCGDGISIGDTRANYPLPPRDVVIEHNVVVLSGSGLPVRVDSPPENWTWRGNTMIGPEGRFELPAGLGRIE